MTIPVSVLEAMCKAHYETYAQEKYGDAATHIAGLERQYMRNALAALEASGYVIVPKDFFLNIEREVAEALRILNAKIERASDNEEMNLLEAQQNGMAWILDILHNSMEKIK